MSYIRLSLKGAAIERYRMEIEIGLAPPTVHYRHGANLISLFSSCSYRSSPSPTGKRNVGSFLVGLDTSSLDVSTETTNPIQKETSGESKGEIS